MPGMPGGLPDWRAGDVLRAEDLAALVKFLRSTKLTVRLPLQLVDGPGGSVLSLARTQEIDARIVSYAAGAYAWQQVIEQVGGTWIDGPLSGTTVLDPAYEMNANSAVAVGTRVRMRRDRGTAQWIFQLALCSQTVKSPVIPPLNAYYEQANPPPIDPRVIASQAGGRNGGLSVSPGGLVGP